MFYRTNMENGHKGEIVYCLFVQMFSKAVSVTFILSSAK